MRKLITTPNAPKPTGIYSPALVADGPFVFVSGQGPLDPATGAILKGGFREQAELTFRNVGALLKAAGTGWEHAVKVTVYLADIHDFDDMNRVYKEFLKEPYPTRTTVEAVLDGIAIEVDCIATLPPS